MIKNPRGDGGAGRYLHLDKPDVELFELMDGRRTIQEVLVANLERNGVFALDRLARLTAALRANGFFGEEPPVLYEKLGIRKAMRDPITRASIFLKKLVMWDVARWSNANGVVDAIYRAGGWLAFTRLRAALNPGTFAGELAFKPASIFVFQFIFNLLPILELDGYYVLVDALDAPFLRQRSMWFVRTAAIRKIRARAKWTGEEIGLAIFGLGAIATSLIALVFSILIWRSRIVIAARELISLGLIGLALFGLLVLVFVGPLIVQIVARVVGIVKTSIGLANARTAAAAQRELGARVAMLARVRFLAGLPGPALAALASHLRVDRVDAEHTVFTAGSVGDRFYLVRSGRLQVISAEGTVLRELIPGDGFGELALLDRTPRTATVQALETAELWPLGTSHFQRWVRDRYEIAARIRADQGERAGLAKLPFFKDLEGKELDQIAARLQARRFEAGDVVVQAGEQGGGYYLIREGTADVTLPDGRFVRTLGPGDGFGELALIFGIPRTATVTAKGPLTVGVLSRPDFATLVTASGEEMRDFRARTGHYVGSGLGGAAAGGA